MMAGARIPKARQQLLDAITAQVQALSDQLGQDHFPPEPIGAEAGALHSPRESARAATGSLRRTLCRAVLAGFDLATAPGVGAPVVAASALATAVRSAARQLAADHPGGQVELRIPPYVAVQCAAPSGNPTRNHTRGTPANVVEIDPETFLRLYADPPGTYSWSDLVASGRIRASGAHCDIRSYFAAAL